MESPKLAEMAMLDTPSGVLSVPKAVVVNTRAVLLSSKHGVLLKNFKRDYIKLVGKSVSYW